MTSTAALLDLEAGGVRAESFIFDLLDSDRNYLGRLDVWADQAPKISVDSTRATVRTCSNVVLRGSQAQHIDQYRDRVRPAMVLSNGVALPMGVFMFGQDNLTLASWGDEANPELFDETFLLSQDLFVGVGVEPGKLIFPLFQQLINEVGLPDVDLSDCNQTARATQALSYQAGSPRIAALTALAPLLAVTSPFFDNYGTLRAKRLPNFDPPADHAYGWGNRILDGTPKITNSIYKAANRYVAVSTTPDQPDLIGIYDLPAAAPNSFAATGRYVTKSKQFQGIPDKETCVLAAYSMALADRQSYMTGTFTSAVDPRHDAYHIVSYFDDKYAEVSFDVECTPGGTMSHQLVRLW